MEPENKELLVDENGEVLRKDASEVTDDDESEDESTVAESSNDSDDSDDSDEAEQASHSDEDREAIRERRRLERQTKKERARGRENTLRSELAARDAIIHELAQKVGAIERRNTGSEVAQLQKAKSDAAEVYNHFKNQVRLASSAGNGDVLVDAMEKMQLAREKFEEFQRIEKAYTRQQANPTPQPLDPRIRNHADVWMRKNTWYDPSGADEDSELMLTIDKRMAKEGWNPTTPEYWDELSRRAQKRLPHLFSQNRSKPRAVVSGSSRESAPSGQQSYKLSADRVQALKDAGMWNDIDKRSEAIKRFKEYDKAHRE